MVTAADLHSLSDDQLVAFILELKVDIAAAAAQIDSPYERRRKTFRVARTTFLTAGGFLAATVDPLGLVLTAVGFLDWIAAMKDDADDWNKRLRLRRKFSDLNSKLMAAEAEVARR